MDENQVRSLLLFINTGVKILSARILLFLALLLTFSLFGFVMFQPTYERILLATIFAILVFLPVVRTDLKTIDSRKTIEGG